MDLNEGLETLGTDERSDDGCMYYGAFEESAIERISIPSTLKKIEYSAFESCKDLELVVPLTVLSKTEALRLNTCERNQALFPDSVTEVCKNAFFGCQNLKKVTFGMSSRLGKIGPGAFGDSGLQTFSAPPSLRTISQAAFCKCKQLK